MRIGIKKGSTYFRLFSTFLLLAILVVSIASTIAYSLFSKIYKEEITSSLVKNMQYEAQRLEAEVFSRATMLIQDLSLNVSYADEFYEILKSDHPNHVSISRVHSMLSSIGGIYNSIVSSVILYYPQQEIIISSNMGYKHMTAPFNLPYKQFVSELPDASDIFMLWDVSHASSDLPGLQDGSVLLFSAARWPGVTADKNAMIIIGLKNSFITEKLDYIGAGDANAYLVKETGEIICRSDRLQNAEPVWLQEEGRSLLSGELSSFLSSDGMLHISAPIRSANWYLVYSTPIDNFDEASREILKIMLLIVASALAISVILTLLFSRRLYSPIRELMGVVKNIQPVTSNDEYASIRTAIDTLSANLSSAQRLEQANRPVIRNMLTHDLLRGLLSSDQSARETLSAAEIILPHENFAVMIVEWCEKDINLLPAEERSTVQFALREQLEGMKDTGASLYAYLASRMSLVLLVNAPEQDFSIIETAAQRAKDMLSALNVRSMCAFGGWTNQLSGLSRVYQTARFEMEFRIMCPEDTLIVPSDQSGGTFPASADEEERFLKFIRESRLKDASASIQSLIKLWNGMPPLSGYRSLLRISSALQEMSARWRLTADDSENPRIISDAKSAVWCLSEYEIAMQHWLESVIDPVGSSGASRNELLLEKTIAYISEHIDEDLSLENLSREMHFNPKYFSRLFKELSGVTLSEFITKKRMKLAGDMLIQNKLTIEEISRRTGYGNPQYFARRFKDEFGVSPREYRIRGWKPENDEQKSEESEK